MRLRSVELQLPDTPGAARFLTDVWGLSDAGTRDRTRFLRGTGDHPYLLSLTEADEHGVNAITFSGSGDEIRASHERLGAAGARRGEFVSEYDEPGAASGFLAEGPEGQVYRFVAEKAPTPALPPAKDRPLQITHAVVNAVDRQACTRFAVEALGFRLSDRTGMMSFLRCNRAHHAIAYADAQFASLNHIAFEMADVDAVMRGIARMRDHGFAAAWGPGRHGPGNNVFGYFVSPFGAVIEYTAEVQQLDDTYREGTPEDWKWPPGRIDHWGISGKDTPRLMEAEQRFRFRPTA
jgi:catechol 2,3-dioxygenase-like lactoylglutathione lyase family enzyme